MFGQDQDDDVYAALQACIASYSQIDESCPSNPPELPILCCCKSASPSENDDNYGVPTIWKCIAVPTCPNKHLHLPKYNQGYARECSSQFCQCSTCHRESNEEKLCCQKWICPFYSSMKFCQTPTKVSEECQCTLDTKSDETQCDCDNTDATGDSKNKNNKKKVTVSSGNSKESIPCKCKKSRDRTRSTYDNLSRSNSRNSSKARSKSRSTVDNVSRSSDKSSGKGQEAKGKHPCRSRTKDDNDSVKKVGKVFDINRPCIGHPNYIKAERKQKESVSPKKSIHFTDTDYSEAEKSSNGKNKQQSNTKETNDKELKKNPSKTEKLDFSREGSEHENDGDNLSIEEDLSGPSENNDNDKSKNNNLNPSKVGQHIKWTRRSSETLKQSVSDSKSTNKDTASSSALLNRVKHTDDNGPSNVNSEECSCCLCEDVTNDENEQDLNRSKFRGNRDGVIKKQLGSSKTIKQSVQDAKNTQKSVIKPVPPNKMKQNLEGAKKIQKFEETSKNRKTANGDGECSEDEHSQSNVSSEAGPYYSHEDEANNKSKQRGLTRNRIGQNKEGAKANQVASPKTTKQTAQNYKRIQQPVTKSITSNKVKQSLEQAKRTGKNEKPSNNRNTTDDGECSEDKDDHSNVSSEECTCCPCEDVSGKNGQDLSSPKIEQNREVVKTKSVTNPRSTQKTVQDPKRTEKPVTKSLSSNKIKQKLEGGTRKPSNVKKTNEDEQNNVSSDECLCCPCEPDLNRRNSTAETTKEIVQDTENKRKPLTKLLPPNKVKHSVKGTNRKQNREEPLNRRTVNNGYISSDNEDDHSISAEKSPQFPSEKDSNDKNNQIDLHQSKIGESIKETKGKQFESSKTAKQTVLDYKKSEKSVTKTSPSNRRNWNFEQAKMKQKSEEPLNSRKTAYNYSEHSEDEEDQHDESSEERVCESDANEEYERKYLNMNKSEQDRKGVESIQFPAPKTTKQTVQDYKKQQKPVTKSVPSNKVQQNCEEENKNQSTDSCDFAEDEIDESGRSDEECSCCSCEDVKQSNNRSMMKQKINTIFNDNVSKIHENDSDLSVDECSIVISCKGNCDIASNDTQTDLATGKNVFVEDNVQKNYINPGCPICGRQLNGNYYYQRSDTVRICCNPLCGQDSRSTSDAKQLGSSFSQTDKIGKKCVWSMNALLKNVKKSRNKSVDDQPNNTNIWKDKCAKLDNINRIKNKTTESCVCTEYVNVVHKSCNCN